MIRVTAWAVANLMLMPLPAIASVNPLQAVTEERDRCALQLLQIEYESRHMAGYETWRMVGGVSVSSGPSWSDFWCEKGTMYRVDG